MKGYLPEGVRQRRDKIGFATLGMAGSSYLRPLIESVQHAGNVS